MEGRTEIRMKAWVLQGIDSLVLKEVPVPALGSGEVLVAVRAAGICGSDIPRVYRTGAHRHPLIPGHEFSGEVVELGENVDRSWLGKRVGVFPLIPCRSCEPCRRKQYEMCRNYDYLGSRRDGGFAEYVAVPVWNLLALPQSVSYEEAAMLEPMAVAVHAMRRMWSESDIRISEYGKRTGCAGEAEAGKRAEFFGEMKAGKRAVFAGETEAGERAEFVGETEAGEKVGFAGEAEAGKIARNIRVAVCGLGTIGLLLLMFLKEAGVREVYAVGNKDFQKEMAKKLGVTEEFYCDSRRQDQHQWLMERTGGRGVDQYYECVGKSETYELAVDGTAPAGRVVLVGNPYSDMMLKKEVYWKILRNQLTILGTWNSSFTQEAGDDWHYVLERLAQGRIAPAGMISHRFALAELRKGLELMRDKREDYVKVMGIF